MKSSHPPAFLHPRLRWQPPSRLTAEPEVLDWLRDTGSLTRRLQGLGRFRVRPLRQRIEAPRAEEAHLLALRPRLQALVREVLLELDGVPVVYARSVIPLQSLRNANRVLGHMARRSLGAELFRAPRARRDRMWMARIPPELVPGGAPAWGRQSLFLKRGKPLLVEEVFLPALWERLEAGPDA